MARRLNLPQEPVPFKKVLRDELDALDARPPGDETPDEAAVYREALDRDLIGVAFSGGGIRSATFNLGILQGLADLRLLRHVKYLSTVSGGGYIGSWLSAMIHRENQDLAADLAESGSAPASEIDGVLRVEERLRTVATSGEATAHREKFPPPHEDPAVTFLRRFSNYLTPRAGFFTTDTWTVLVTYLRNLLLNLTLLAAGLAAVLLTPRLIVAVTEWLTAWGPARDGDRLFWIALGSSLALGVLATVLMGCSFAALMTREDAADEDHSTARNLQQPAILWGVVLPLAAASFLTFRWLLSDALDGDPGSPLAGSWYEWSGGAALAYAVAWILAFAGARFSRWSWDQRFDAWLGLILTAAVSGALAGPLLKVLGGFLRTDDWFGWVWGPPAVLAWLLLVGIVQTGLMGIHLRDHEREWLSRLGAWLLIFATGWLVWFAIVVYGPVVWSTLGGWVRGTMVSGWLGATLSGLLAARGRPANGQPSPVKVLVLAVAPYVFVAGFLILLAVGLDRGVSAVADGEAWTAYEENLDAQAREREIRQAAEAVGLQDLGPERSLWGDLYEAHCELLDRSSDEPGPLAAVIVSLLLVSLVLAWRIDVNEFSLHGLYRNRLVRAYLGASMDPEERYRGAQPFTGFHKRDDLKLADLYLAHDGLTAPIHLLNTSLNLVSGAELAWQDRKAAPFVLSPLYCGFEPRAESFCAGAGSAIHEFGYRSTVTGYGSDPVQLTLGSATAISGAAASPHMGFRSTPALAFLLTVFNVRLGWWLGNPRHRRAWTRSGPFLSLIHLFLELFGKTRAHDRYVYLSDGEHFENLGVYELVRRRCRFILATDVGADKDYTFENLGNAIRKCQSDLGVEIRIDVDKLRPDCESGYCPWHCAVGEILYPASDGGVERGTLLYVKASLTGDEPEDVLSYAQANPPFPHQTTADQFFDESQFESYRSLGHHVAIQVLEDAADVAARPEGEESKPFRLEKLVLALDQRWHAPSVRIAEAFTRHAAGLDQLFERARRTPELKFLDAQVYPEWHRLLEGAKLPRGARRDKTETLWLPDDAGERRQGFYFCNSLIQLMENVYIDLDLDREHGHPDNRGWMNLFKHWTWSGMFRATWAISASTYGHRFQAFCQRRLGLELGSVAVDWLYGPDRRQAVAAAAFRSEAEGKGADFLNFLEREQVEIFLRYGDTGVLDVAHFELEVEDVQVKVPRGKRSRAEKPFSFGFGYALLDAEGKIVLFRVQDHLRTMGLGRQALTRLLPELDPSSWPADEELCREHEENVETVTRRGNRDGTPPADAAACQRFRSEFRGGGNRYVSLLRSVRRELAEEASNGS